MDTKFIEDVVRLRKEQRLSQKALGQRANIAQTTISEWERGNSLPDIYQAEMLAKALGTTLINILNGKAFKSKKN